MTSSSNSNSNSSSQKSVQQHLAETSYFEKLALTPKKLYVLGNAIIALLTAKLYIRTKRPPTYYRYVIYTVFRTMTRITTLGQQHYMQPTTDEAYLIACKKLNLKPESESLPDGTLMHWIGSKTASKLIVNFHGGGYVLTASPDQYEFLSGLQQLLSKQGKDVAVIFLSYDLAPKAKYPRQLEQATAFVDYIINKLNKKPSDLILIGDSAGANLITQLISHISHPHPSIPKLSITEKFRAMCLISPWISFDTSAASFERNAYSDILSPAAGKKWSTAFMGTPWPHSNSDAYNEAITAPPGWWDEMMVDDVLITGGEDEVIIDSIKEFAENLKEVIGDRCITFFAQGEMHAQPYIDLGIGFKEPGASAQAVRSWFSEKF